jgi:hypothetical protein
MTVFAQDFFTDKSGTKLTSHEPNVGGPWLRRAGRGPGVKVFINSVSAASAKLYRYTISGVPGSVDYDVDASFALIAPNAEVWGLIARFVDANNFYEAYYDDSVNTYYLDKTVAGITEHIDDHPEVYAGIKAFKFELGVNSQKLYIDDVEKLSGVDEDLQAAGVTGIVMSATDEECWCDNFVATDTAVSTNACMTLKKVWWAK